MKILYLIPARQGSKGLPNKNTKILGNKPLVEYSIDFAIQNMKVDDELCISTNDPQVIKVAESKGIKIPFIRPEILSNDKATSYDVIKHALNHYKNYKKFDAILLLQPTSPFRYKQDLISLINEYDEETEMVTSVCLAKENPYFTLFEEDDNGFLQKSKKADFERRQDCPKIYLFNGSMYLIKVEAIKKYKISEIKKIKKIIMPIERSIDIDTIEDWILAEYFLNNYHKLFMNI
jgi:CMP-N,N'-diacetyllegionaminic acid synthase